jgi:membrane protein implicated in regulation of membrane protease activity
MPVSFITQPMFVWFFVAVVFLVAELMAPGFVAIFFTLGCLAASCGAWLFGMPLQTQIIVFVVVSIGSLVLFRKMACSIFRGKQGSDNEDDYSNERIGKTVVVTEPVVPHRQGKVKLDGSFWIAESDSAMDIGDVGIVESVDAENSLVVKIKPIDS